MNIETGEFVHEEEILAGSRAKYVRVPRRYASEVNALVAVAKAEGRTLWVSDLPDVELQRWAAGKLALEKKPKSKIPGRKRRK